MENSIEASELPFQERRELFEGNAQQQLPQQQSIQQMQFDQDTATQTLASIQMGKRPFRPINNDHEHDTTIQILLDKILQLQNKVEQLSTTNKGAAQSTPMHHQISTPVGMGSAQLEKVDELQVPNDPYRAALGHEDLQAKIHNWALEVIKIQRWPKPQMVAGTITGVTNVVQAEVARITRENGNNIANTNSGYKDVLDVVQQQTNTKHPSVAMQASPISMSSGGSNSVGNERSTMRSLPI